MNHRISTILQKKSKHESSNRNRRKLITNKRLKLDIISIKQLSSFQNQYILERQLCSAVESSNIETISVLLQRGADIHARTCDTSPIYLATKLERYDIVDYLRMRGAHFGSVQTTGKFAGFTTLHFACLEKNNNTVNTLVQEYKVDPTAVANDGSQPVHIAALVGSIYSVHSILLAISEVGGNIDIELTYTLYKKYAKGSRWRDNFGEKMPLLIFLFINHAFGNDGLIDWLIPTSQHITIRDNNNKTFLMYLAEQNFKFCRVGLLIELFKTRNIPEWSARDNFGYTFVHHLLGARGFEKCKYDSQQIELDYGKLLALRDLDEIGININIMVNNDPRTLPIHIAAYYGLPKTLKFLLEGETFFTSSARPLFYALQNYEINSANYSLEDHLSYMPLIDDHAINIAKIIIEDIFRKLLVKYPIHKKEIELLDHLVIKEPVIKEFVQTLDEKYKIVIPVIKQLKARFGHRKIFLYDALKESHKNYIVAVQEDDFFSCGASPVEDIKDEIDEFELMVQNRYCTTIKRIELMNKWEKIATLIVKCLLLPYDCVRYVIEFLTNDALENLIKAYEFIDNNL